MKTILLACGAALALLPAAWAQDKNIHDVVFEYRDAIKKIEGVLDISVGGINGEKRIIVRVDSSEAQATVEKLVGKKIEGFPIRFLVSARPKPAEEPKAQVTSAEAASPPAELKRPSSADPSTRSPLRASEDKQVGQTVAEPRKPEPKIDISRLDDLTYALERCDVLREKVGLPQRDAPNGVRCREMIGWTNDPDKIKWVIAQGLPHWESAEMGSGLHVSSKYQIPCPQHGGHGGSFVAYTYIRHRQFCPLGMKQILKDLERMTPTR